MGSEPATKQDPAPVLASTAGVCKRYVQRAAFSRQKFVVDALQNADLEVLNGGVTALVGQSGSGKSSLARCLALIEKPDRGKVWFEGVEISNWTPLQISPLRPRIQMVFQDSAGALNPRFSAVEIVQEPLEIQRRAQGSTLRNRACELMEEVGLSAAWADRFPRQLSGGQRQRLAIARALALQPSLLILDESLSGLDLVTQSEILRLLSELQRRHSLTYLIVSHDLSLVAEIADSIAVMHEGTVVEQKNKHELLGQPHHSHTRELLGYALRLDSAWHAAAGELR